MKFSNKTKEIKVQKIKLDAFPKNDSNDDREWVWSDDIEKWELVKKT